LLVGDESGKEMPYTQEATIRTHFKKLKKFVKLMDYLIVDSKVHRIIEPKLAMMSNSADQIVG
jgi:dynein heavy chain